MNIVKCHEWKPKQFNILKRKNKKLFCEAMYLDTETSHNHNENDPVGWIYQWAFVLGDDIVVGRKPSELINCLKRFESIMYDDSKLVIYIHNLSYDFQYLKQYLIAAFGIPKIVATDNRKIISAEFDRFIFKCSYLLSNMSLDQWSKKLNTKHKKAVGTVDYDIFRYQDTELTKEDWTYQILDVIVLKECLEIELKKNNDTLLTIPLTSTGYVRRDARRKSFEDRQNRKDFLNTRLDEALYIKCKLAFSGGLTHGNYLLRDELLEGNIRHRDFRSHYPSQQRVKFFPLGKFKKYTNSKDRISIEDIKEIQEKYCCLISIEMWDIELKKNVTLPYLQQSKIFQGAYSFEGINIYDNGRVIKFKPHSTIILTELDLDIISRQYFFKYKILEVDISEKGPLPVYLIDTIDSYYLGKSKYKNLAKKENNEFLKKEYEYLLMKSKNKLNGIYGMTATDIVRPEFEMNEIGEVVATEDEEKSISDYLDSYYNSRNSFLPYQFGVWTTAYARYELIKLVEIIGYENYIYSDTDSLFYFSSPEIEKRIDEYNKKEYENAIKIGAYIEYDNNIVTYSAFEDEDEDITAFKFLHSKCYAYICKNELKCTIAGVSAYGRNGNTRVNELADINNLKSGYIFKDCGGTITKYVDELPSIQIINGHTLEVSSSAIIFNSDKKLNNNIDEKIYTWNAGTGELIEE